MLALWHWHIEISSKCTLRCPRCSRQEVPNGLVNTELSLPFFRKNFNADFVQQHVQKITFCGDDGDPIYAHDLIPVITYFKSIKPEIQIVIVTNGSHKKQEWWQRLAMVLNANDHVHFSIDGWDQESNEKYRVNSDWNSTMLGIRMLSESSDCYMTWAAIAFKFNQHKLHVMKDLAHDLGMDRFQLTRSTKFGSIYPNYGNADELEPSADLVSSSLRFEREITNITDRRCPDDASTAAGLFHAAQQHNGVLPLCAVGNKGMFINSQGDLFPCCWVANRYSHNNEWLQRGREFNLKQRSMQQVLEDPFWKEQFLSFHWMECQTKCNSKQVDFEYATAW